MSNFSFSHSVFKRLVLWTHKNKGSFGKGLNVIQVIKFSFAIIKRSLASPAEGQIVYVIALKPLFVCSSSILYLVQSYILWNFMPGQLAQYALYLTRDLFYDQNLLQRNKWTNAWQKYRIRAGFQPRIPRQKANTITTELKRIRSNTVVRYCI